MEQIQTCCCNGRFRCCHHFHPETMKTDPEQHQWPRVPETSQVHQVICMLPSIYYIKNRTVNVLFLYHSEFLHSYSMLNVWQRRPRQILDVYTYTYVKKNQKRFWSGFSQKMSQKLFNMWTMPTTSRRAHVQLCSFSEAKIWLYMPYAFMISGLEV